MGPSMLALAGTSLAIAAAIYLRLRPRLPPGPRPWPVVGNLYDVKPVRFRCFAEWAQTYGPIMSVWFGNNLAVVVSSSELAREVLREKDQQLADRPRTRSTANFSHDGADLIWADYGPHYVKVRKACNLELFSPKRLDALRPIREDEATAMVESIFRDATLPDNIGKSLDLRNYLGAVTFNMITRLVFGKRFVKPDGSSDEQGVEFKTIVSIGNELNASLSFVEYVSWLQWMCPLDVEAYNKNDKRRERLTKIIMEEHAQARSKDGAKEHFVDALLTLKDEYDLSDNTITGLLWDMITAGIDTVAISVEWAMAEIVKNPSIQEKIQEELDGVIGRERIMTEADIGSLPYLQCVVKESLRLHPPTPLMLPHKARSKVKIGGYDVPKGSSVIVNVWAIARDPRTWKEPLEYRPERFLEEDIDVKGQDFRVLPFGTGRRICPGAQLGINLMSLMLGHLLHHFRWGLPAGIEAENVDMGETPGLVTFMRTPLQVVAVPRLPSRLYARVPAKI